MKEEDKKKEAEELQSLLLQMMETKTDVTLAVQTFRKFVLNFCGGKEGSEQPMSEEATEDESE